MNVVKEMPPGMSKIKLVKIALSRVGKRRMPHIVTECDRFNKVKIEIKNRTDRASYARNELNVMRSASYIVVLVKGENLRFIGISVVLGTVHYFIYVTHICGAPHGFSVEIGISAFSILTLSGKVGACSLLYIFSYSIGYFRR